jgi:beta-phosphoglucomutase
VSFLLRRARFRLNKFARITSLAAIMNSSFAVIFDNDGVLVDSEAFSEQAYRDALLEQGVEVEAGDGERYCGLTDADILNDLVQRCGRQLDLDQFVARKRDLYFELASRQSMRVFPGALELLESLRLRSVPLALASSAPHEKIDFNLQHSGLGQFFRYVISGEECHRGKPDPEIFLRAGQLLDIEPGQCVVIEDSINGLRAARGAVMTAVGVAHTFTKERLEPYADHIVASLEELTPDVLQHLIVSRVTAR